MKSSVSSRKQTRTEFQSKCRFHLLWPPSWAAILGGHLGRPSWAAILEHQHRTPRVLSYDEYQQQIKKKELIEKYDVLYRFQVEIPSYSNGFPTSLRSWVST